MGEQGGREDADGLGQRRSSSSKVTAHFAGKKVNCFGSVRNSIIILTFYVQVKMNRLTSLNTVFKHPKCLFFVVLVAFF